MTTQDNINIQTLVFGRQKGRKEKVREGDDFCDYSTFLLTALLAVWCWSVVGGGVGRFRDQLQFRPSELRDSSWLVLNDFAI